MAGLFLSLPLQVAFPRLAAASLFVLPHGRATRTVLILPSLAANSLANHDGYLLIIIIML